MKYSLLFLLLSFFFSNVIGNEKEPFKKSINFNQKDEKGGKLNPEDFAGYDELRRWAVFQSMNLQIDSNKYGLKDGICRMIPAHGFSFYLTFDTSIKKPIYLYLDLTTYEGLENKTYPIRSLSVLINGRTKGKVFFNANATETNPYILSIDPIECPKGRINITLIPDSATDGRFWGIWDAFYSYGKE